MGSVSSFALQWGVTYPFDVLKSRIQTLPDSAPREMTSIAHNIKQLLKEAGPRAFVVGLSTTILRSIPTNAITFYMYELSLARFKQLHDTR